jgi:uroporphyrinogen decarboxylase
MSANSRELVYQALHYENPARAPRDVWPLPWCEKKYPGAIERIREEFPMDFVIAPPCSREVPPTKGDIFAVGRYVDEWGCPFDNIQEGIVGEVKDPPIKDWDTDIPKVHIPRELLTLDRDVINRFCAGTDQFVISYAMPRPFEQFQFLRGSANLYMDLLMQPPRMMSFLKEIHEYYCELMQLWAKSDVDALWFMDDWGSQRTLLIDPELWREIFKPLYRDYIQIAHSAGKKCFMHSDGMILDVIPDLIELGLDALNSQIFCIGVEKLAPFAGKLTFWGEIDRQQLLPRGTVEEIDRAVREVHRTLWRQGGCIAQCEFGIGPKPENVRQVFATWNDLVPGD